MPITRFQLLMSLNYNFTKTKDCLRIGIVGVSNTFLTRNQTSEHKNQDFLPIQIKLGKMTFVLT